MRVFHGDHAPVTITTFSEASWRPPHATFAFERVHGGVHSKPFMKASFGVSATWFT